MAFFRSRMSLKTFCWPLLPQQKKSEKWLFLDQNHGLTSLENTVFFGLFKIDFL